MRTDSKRKGDESVTTRDWLERARRLDGEIDALLEARQMALDRVSCAGGQILAAIPQLSLEEKLREKVETLLQVKEEVLEVIFQVPDGTLRQLLVERFLNGKTWEQVAQSLTYSYSQVVKYKFPAALRAVEQVRRRPSA